MTSLLQSHSRRLSLPSTCPKTRLCQCHASSSDSDSRHSERVQGELVDAINQQVARHRAKDELRDGLDRMADRLKMDLVRRADKVCQRVALSPIRLVSCTV